MCNTKECHFDGWDLPAYCYVQWHIPSEPLITSGLTRATIQQIRQDHHRELADQLLRLPPAAESVGPSPTTPVSDDAILEFLIPEGLRPGTADDLTNTLRRIRLLAAYYCNNFRWEDVPERETRSFWSFRSDCRWAEQQIKIELPVNGGRADIACFSKP